MEEYTKSQSDIISKYLSNQIKTTVVYDKKTKRFLEQGIGTYMYPVAQEIVDDTVNKIGFKIIKVKEEEDIQAKLINKYSESVNYYYHKPQYDGEGIFVLEDNKKRYLTFAELDETLEKYNKKFKIKIKSRTSSKIERIHIQNDKDSICVWTCDYCKEEFKTKFESDEHEKTCLLNPNYVEKLKIKNAQILEQRTNKSAIIGFILSLISVFLLPGLFGITGMILGIIALTQIKDTHEKGNGFAITATIIGFIWGVLWSLLKQLVQLG